MQASDTSNFSNLLSLIVARDLTAALMSSSLIFVAVALFVRFGAAGVKSSSSLASLSLASLRFRAPFVAVAFFFRGAGVKSSSLASLSLSSLRFRAPPPFGSALIFVAVAFFFRFFGAAGVKSSSCHRWPHSHSPHSHYPHSASGLLFAGGGDDEPHSHSPSPKEVTHCHFHNISSCRHWRFLLSDGYPCWGL